MARWSYSRKKPGFDPYGGFRVVRQPAAPVVKAGRVMSDTVNAFRVQLDEDPPNRHRFISKKHATIVWTDREAARANFTIPAWLWAKMTDSDAPL